MDDVLQWGLDLIVTIQQIHGPLLDSVFSAMSYLGREEFYLLLLPLLLWCLDFKLGARLAILFLLSTFVNAGLKDIFQQQRPFELESSVGLSDAEGYGMPSNHAQSAVVVWGAIAARIHRAWTWVVAAVLMLAIGFSRVYLGVHFPTDVLAGWVIGALLLAAYLLGCSAIERWLVMLPVGIQLALAAFVPVVFTLLHPVKDVGAAMGALAGAGMGLSLMQRYVPLKTIGPWWQRLLRFLFGGVVVLGLYLVPKAMLPEEGETLYLIFRFLHYWLVGMWITLGAAWLFRILRLTHK